MKIDRYVRDISHGLDDLSNDNGNGHNNNDDSYGLIEHDDEYYLDIGSEPPRFAKYRAARQIKNEVGDIIGHEDVFTQDEFDYYLKLCLRDSPEQRYQNKKEHWYFHDSSWYMRNVNGYDGIGCNNGVYVSECRYYAKEGRIEYKEVLSWYEQRSR